MNSSLIFRKITRFIIMFGTISALAMTASTAHAEAAFGDGLDEKRNKVANMFKRVGGDHDAKGSTWPQDREFMVGVAKDFSRPKDYAEYVCNVLIDNGLGKKSITVRIVDVEELLKTRGGWVYLATMKCK